MKQSKPTPNRKPARKPDKQDELMVKGAVLTGFLNAQLSAFSDACNHVAEEKKDSTPDAKAHCDYYLDGARQYANMILDMITPVRAADIIKASAGYINGLATNIDRIAKETKVPREFVLSYVNGARKLSDVLIEAIAKSPRVDANGKAADQGGNQDNNQDPQSSKEVN